MDNPEQITYFAETDARNQRIPFGIKAKDRTRHVYVIGKTGMGKSTLLENMAAQDIKNGNGFAFMDPHGQAIDTLLEYIPPERVKDVLYFAPFDMEFPVSFNIMEDVGYDKRHLVVSGLMGSFKKIWQDAWSARMEYILSNTLLALLEYPDATLLSVNKMLSDKNYRKKVVDNVTDTSVKSFWVDEFANYTERMAAEAVPAIQNKVGQFTSNPLIRNIIGQPKSSFDIRSLMDNKKILLINLSKGRIGEQNANLLGSLLITKIYLSAMSRADVALNVLEGLPNFYLYVDEFQSFANESFADILSEARKYKLNLTIAHQYIEQMSDEVRAAVFGNVGTMITFRVGSFDAETLEKEFIPTFTATDIVNLGFAQVYLRLMIDGIGSHPFSAKTLPPLEKPEASSFDSIMNSSREQFAQPRAEVEAKVRELVESGREEAKLEEMKKADTRKRPPKLGKDGKPILDVPGVDPNAPPVVPEKTKQNNTDLSVQKKDNNHNAKTETQQSNKVDNFDGKREKSDFKKPNNIPNKKINFPVEDKGPSLKEQLEAIQKQVANNPTEKKVSNELSEPVKSDPVEVLSAVSSKDKNLNEVSLSDLKERKPRKDPKVASPEHKNELKNALSSVLGSIEPKEEKKEDVKNPESFKTSTNAVPQNNASSPNLVDKKTNSDNPVDNFTFKKPQPTINNSGFGTVSVPEIPEDDLKEMFDIPRP